MTKKYDILFQSVKKVHKLFHRTNKPIAVVKPSIFSGVEKWSI